MSQEEKKKYNFKIIIEGKKRIIKELDGEIKLSQLREILKEDITNEFYFEGEDNCEIQENDEIEWTLKEIAQNDNIINVKKKHIEIMIKIFLDEIIYDEVKCSKDLNLNELRKLLNKIDDNFLFLNKDGVKIEIQNESNFKIDEIIVDEKINIKKRDNNIIIMLGNEQFMSLNNIDFNQSLSEFRDLCKISEDYNFLFLEKKIEKEKESELYIYQIINKKQEKNYIYIIYLEKESNEKEKDLKDNIINDSKNNIIKKSNFLEQLQDLFIFFQDMEFSPELKEKGIFEEYEYFNENYSQLRGIERLTIPIFGIISSGKSTLLNYLLNLDNILEMDNDVCTQFICIIRNKRGLENPKIYNVKLKSRDKKFVNFIKGNEIKGNIKSIIKEKNKQIKELQKIRNPEDFFLLIETDIPFLNELDNDYSEFFEFMDFPGLNENSNINLFYKDYLSLILPNITFSIFIFQIGSFESLDNYNILSNYKDFSQRFKYPEMEKICKKSFGESIFILNKIDLIKSEEEKNNQLEIFREKFELNENNSLYFSSKEKLLENNKFNSFYQFIEYIINDDGCNFVKFLEKKLEEELNLKNISDYLKNPPKEEDLDEEELNKFNDLINDKNYIFKDFNKEEYLKYKNIFLNNKKTFKENDLTILLKNKIKNIYVNLTDFSKFKNSLKLMKKNEKKNENSFSDYLIVLHKEIKEIEERIFNKNQLLQIENEIDKHLNKFLTISEKSPRIKLCKERNDNFIKFLNSSEITFKILVFGKYSTGKSSLLNSIIGYNLNILHTSINECTKKAFIIKYCKSTENISLIKSEKKRNDYKFYYFEEKEEIAKGLENVKNKIEEINNLNNKNFEYYIVKTPIEVFDDWNLTEEEKNRIEFIDLPGFDIKGFRDIIFYSEKMINFMDGLIYVNNGNVIDDQQNINAINDIFIQIRLYKENFSNEQILFAYTHADENKYNMKNITAKLKGLITDNFKSQKFNDIIYENEYIKERDFLVSKIGNSYYKEYQEFKNFKFNFDNLDDLENNLKKNYMIIEEEELNNYKPSNDKLEYTQNKIKDIFNINQANEQIQRVSILYLFILDNIDKYKKYQKSNAKEFFEVSKNLISNAQKSYWTTLTHTFSSFFFGKICHPLIMIKLLTYEKSIKFLSKKEVLKRKENINNYLNTCNDKKNKIFTGFIEKFTIKLTELKTFCGEKEFEEKLKKFDADITKEIEILKKDLDNSTQEFLFNCNKELDKFRGAVLGDSYRDFHSYLGSYINVMEKVKKSALTVGGINGTSFLAGGIYSVITTASVTGPVIGMIIGGIFALVCLGVFGYRFFKGKKKIQEEYIDEYFQKFISQINNSIEEFNLALIENAENYKDYIDEINDLGEENPYDFIKNKKILEENFIGLIEYVKSIKNLFISDIKENNNL